MKFKDINKKGRKSRKTKTNKPHIPKKYTPELKFSLNVEISDKYKGLNDNIAGVINSLPKELKSLLGHAELNQVKVSHNYSIFVLDNKWYLKVKDTVIADKKHLHVIIKENNKQLFNKFIRI